MEAGALRGQHFSGALPPGLSLSADGKVSGTLPVDAPNGMHTFSVRGQSPTGLMALGTFALEIGASVEVEAGGGGCAGIPGGRGELGLYVFGALLLLFGRHSPRDHFGRRKWP